MVDLSGARRIERSASATGARAEAPPSRWAPLQWSERQLATAGLVLLVLAAIGLRLVPILVEPSLNWWDEVFQVTEPAHRLVYGYGLVPWEFQLGMRSWLLPGIVTGLMELSRLVGDGPEYYLPVIATSFAVLASAPVVCCFLWARRWFGLAGAFAAAASVAVAPELVYLGARTLSETVAGHLLVIGCFLLEPGSGVTSRRRLFAAGILLGLVCLLRIHLAPAVALVVLWASWGVWRQQFLALFAGGLAATAFGTVLDWLTLGYPLASLWRNVLYNVLDGVSSDFGTAPWNSYLLGELGLWGSGGLFLVLAAMLGARVLPVLLAAAAAIVAVHSGFAHKEYRFIYPAVLLIMVLAGLGIGQLTEWGAEWLVRRGMKRHLAGAACAVLLLSYSGVLMLGVWTSPTMVQLRSRVHDNLLAISFAAKLPAICGVGLYGEQGRDWVMYGGYSYLHRPLPMYWPADQAELAATAPAFDTLLYSAAPPPALGFETAACFGEICVARRHGGCVAQSMAAMPFPAPVAGLAPSKEAFPAIPASAAAAASR
jgi:phosphatidylinositol glycan class B